MEPDLTFVSSLFYWFIVPNLPIHSASFLGDSGSVVVSGRRPFFYIYDAAAGKVRYQNYALVW